MPAQNIPNPDCRVCHGSGTDEAFGSTCTECWVDANREAAIAARYQGVRTLPSDRAYTPGERLDGRTFGSSTGSIASEKQLAYIERLASQVDDEVIPEAIRRAMDANSITKRSASNIIDALQGIIASTPRLAAASPTAPAAAPRTNRYGGRCVECGSQVEAGAGFIRKDAAGRWVTFHGSCPARPAYVPANADHDTNPAQGGSGIDAYTPERGHVHVIADEFYRVHIAQRSGRPYAVKAIVLRTAEWGTDDEGNRVVLVPGEVEWNYEEGRGKVTQMTADTRITAEQAKAFGEMVGRCMFCSHAIDTPESVAAGYGPVCATKHGLPWG